jgi:hypothetical protein
MPDATPCHRSSCTASHPVGGRFVRVVGALPAVEVRAVATLIVRAVLRAEALVRGPRLDQVAVHGEVIVRQERLCPLVHLGEEALRHFRREQTVVVLREHGMVPHHLVHAQAHEPAKQ